MQTWECAKPGSADWQHITMLISRHESSPSDKDEYRYVVTIFTIVNIVTTVYYSKQYYYSLLQYEIL